MRIVAKLTSGLAVAFAMGIASASADGVDKGRSYAAPSGYECPGSKFGGFYAGVYGGFGSLTSTLTPEGIISIEKTKDGFEGGGRIGHNWVRCNGLFGLEADLSFADFDSKSAVLGGLIGPDAPTISRSMDWLGSLRAKGGIAVGDAMIYVTGGVAFAKIQTSFDFLGFNITEIDETRVGWVSGVGTEYAISDSVRITGEVLYYDFGTETGRLNPDLFGPNDVKFDDHHSLWVSRIGVNFKLGHREQVYEPMK